MQTFHKRFSVVAGFALLLLLLVADMLAIRKQLATQAQAQTWVEHTQDVLLQLNRTQSLLTDAETGQRGYLYTQNERYLGPYNASVMQMGPSIDALARLTADNADEQARVGKLRTLAQAKLSELAETIALDRAGRTADARALVLSDRGMALMSQVRAVIGEMTVAERSLAAGRRIVYDRSVRLTLGCLYLVTALSVAGLVLLGYFILREISLREGYARQVEARESWFRVTLTSLGDAVIATDEVGKVTFLNPIAEQLTGYASWEAAGQDMGMVFPIFHETTLMPVENPVNIVIKQGRTVGLANHTVLRRRDGSHVAIEDSAAPIRDVKDKLIGVVLVFRDATEDRRTQEMLRKSEKLAAAARLSATVAHEINNPLEAIGNLLYLAATSPGLAPDVAAHLQLAEDELERISHITRQTLGFYRESNVPGLIEMDGLVEGVLRIHTNKLATKNIHVERLFTPCPPVLGLAGELRQVVSNLISNAADAVVDGGMICVSLRCVWVGGRASTVVVRVEDNGPGIAPENLKKVFEPFFTTKKDVGTGLGLWVSREIVERHGGTLLLETSTIGEKTGTAFEISLPMAAGPADLVN